MLSIYFGKTSVTPQIPFVVICRCDGSYLRYSIKSELLISNRFDQTFVFFSIKLKAIRYAIIITIFSILTIIISIIDIINTIVIITFCLVIVTYQSAVHVRDFIYSLSSIATFVKLGYVTEDGKNEHRLYLIF